MTICALLLAQQFYDLNPSVKFRYATLGLLFVNVSVGGTLTHFAAPPVLMVAAKWSWNTSFMLTHFGWKAIIGIVVANLIYFAVFSREFATRQRSSHEDEQPEQWSDRTNPVPAWVTVKHLAFLGWTVFTAHCPALFIGGFLFFLAFTAATQAPPESAQPRAQRAHPDGDHGRVLPLPMIASDGLEPHGRSDLAIVFAVDLSPR